MMFWQSSGPFDHVLLLTIMGVTFNVIIITHASTSYCCEALQYVQHSAVLQTRGNGGT